MCRPNSSNFKAALNSYLETLIWSESLSSCDEDGNPYELEYEGCTYQDGCSLDEIISRDQLPDSIIQSASDDLEGFLSSCREDLGIDPLDFFDPGQVGHDFALSRNGHGAGFFDADYMVTANGPNGTSKEVNMNNEFQKIARHSGTHGLVVWVDSEGALQIEEHS